MPFNSTEFLIFFVVVFAVYWAVKRFVPLQNLILLSAGYVFYGWFNAKFVAVLATVTATGYLFGILISKDRRKWILGLGIAIIGGCLAFIKYQNFFVDSIAETARVFDHEVSLSTVKILLPIGLSYYVFQSIGYLVDVHRGKTLAERDAVTYFAYVAFFPSILSGPIAQSRTILPQFRNGRALGAERFVSGIQLILWGLFKKVVVADSLAATVNYVFTRHNDLSGSVLLTGVVFYSFQLYADFSGYSDMARGLAKLLGFELMENFRTPYFSQSVAEFWRNWHRSLSAWMKDYIYLTLGGRGGSRWIHARNILITFTFSGLWHGASWNFVIWGFVNGLLFLPSILSGRAAKRDEAADVRIVPGASEIGMMAATFMLITLTRVFFRTPDLASAANYFGTMFSTSLLSVPDLSFWPLWSVALMLLVEWLQRPRSQSFQFDRWHLAVRVPVYAGMIAAIAFALNHGASREYLYFKF